MLAVAGTNHNSVFIVNRKPNLHIVKTFTNHTKPVTVCKFVDDGETRNRLITLGYDKKLRDWDVDTGKMMKSYN